MTQEKNGVTRRNFLTGAAALGGSAALAGLVGCSSGSDNGSASTGTEQGAIDWLGAAPEISESDCSETIETEVLVIGSAVAGSLAGFGALENGAKVTILERNSIFHYGGNQASFLNSKFQVEENGRPEYDPYELVYHIISNTANRADISLWKSWAFRSGELLDTLIEKVATPSGLPVVCSPSPVEPEKPMNKVYDMNVVLGDPTKDSYKEFLSAMHDYLDNGGADINYNTKAEKLVQDDSGRIIGAIASQGEGNYIFYKASKGVIVATGGFASNEDMIQEFYSPKIRSLLDVGSMYPMYMETEDLPDEPMDDGLGHRMLCWSGGQMEDSTHGYLCWANGGHIGMPYLQVDQAGNRFMNEAFFPVNYAQQAVEQYMPYGNHTWEIMDSGDQLMPCFIGIDPGVLDTIAQSGGGVFQADTIEELAEQIDADPETLKATIDRYNEQCEKGTDDDFMKQPDYLLPIKTPPFTAIKMQWVFTCTLGGVKTNADFQVMDETRKPIPGLYAAGNTVGRRYGYNYDCSGMGTSNAQAMVAGYVAGEVCATEQ